MFLRLRGYGFQFLWISLVTTESKRWQYIRKMGKRKFICFFGGVGLGGIVLFAWPVVSFGLISLLSLSLDKLFDAPDVGCLRSLRWYLFRVPGAFALGTACGHLIWQSMERQRLS